MGAGGGGPRRLASYGGGPHTHNHPQLLLSNDSVVVETAADLLHSLVQFNIAANTKLYLTGAFYFACR